MTCSILRDMTNPLVSYDSAFIVGLFPFYPKYLKGYRPVCHFVVKDEIYTSLRRPESEAVCH
jgi:hypothetical protein